MLFVELGGIGNDTFVMSLCLVRVGKFTSFRLILSKKTMTTNVVAECHSEIDRWLNKKQANYGNWEESRKIDPVGLGEKLARHQ